MLESKRKIKILDFDIETRPLSFWYDGKPTAEITAIASCWANDLNSMQVSLLGRDDPREALIAFKERYDEADIVTGHYLRKFDLPIIAGAMMENGLPALGPKISVDTRLDMIKKGDIPATQEFLCELLGIPLPKIYMSQVAWREGNRLTPKGLELTERRVTGDVYQHMLLRLKMSQLGLLSSPKVWKP